MAHLSRRQFLHLTALTLVSSAVAACGLGQTSTPTSVGTAPATVVAAPTTGATAATAPAAVAATPAPSPTPIPYIAPSATHPLGKGSTVSITPNDRFYDVAISQRSDWLQASTYLLAVSGAVATPLTLSLNDLKALPAVEQMRTLECIGNPVGGNLIGNAMWKGVRLNDVLAKAGLSSTTAEIKLTSADGFYTTIPVGLATHQDSLLVYEMNGVPLPDLHGGPLRCLFPGRYGMKQPKWISSIEAITQPMLGFWESQSWSNTAIVQVNSQIRTPDGSEKLSAAPYPVSGTAWSNENGIAKLDVSVDGGKTWNEARLVRGPTPLAWTEWSYDWPSPVDATIIARATDNDGNQQPLQADQSMSPDNNIEGKSAVHRVSVTMRQ